MQAPLASPNGTCSFIRLQLFCVFIYGLLRMRIGLMEMWNNSPQPNALPEIITYSNCLCKRNTNYWVVHACSLLVKLLKSTNSPDIFEITSTSDYLELKVPQKSSPSLSGILNQAQIFEKCLNQMHVASNIVYAAWGLRAVIENGDKFLMSNGLTEYALSDRFIRRHNLMRTMGKRKKVEWCFLVIFIF